MWLMVEKTYRYLQFCITASISTCKNKISVMQYFHNVAMYRHAWQLLLNQSVVIYTSVSAIISDLECANNLVHLVSIIYSVRQQSFTRMPFFPQCVVHQWCQLPIQFAYWPKATTTLIDVSKQAVGCSYFHTIQIQMHIGFCANTGT